MMFLVGPAEPMQGPPHGGHTQLLALVLRPPGAVFLQRGIRRRLQPRQQGCLLVTADRARPARDGLAREGPRLALMDDGTFDGRHGDIKAASGYSHGLTVGHRSHQAFFQVGRIGTRAIGICTSRACRRFS